MTIKQDIKRCKQNNTDTRKTTGRQQMMQAGQQSSTREVEQQ